MKQAAAKKTTPEKSPKSTIDGTALAFQFLDTAWRVAAPILLLTYIGNKLDKYYHTKPTLLLICFFLSLLIAAGLVFTQIRTIFPDFFKKKGNER